MHIDVNVEGKTPQEILQMIAKALAAGMSQNSLEGIAKAMNSVPGITAQHGGGGGP